MSGRNVYFFSVTASGTYSYHCAREDSATYPAVSIVTIVLVSIQLGIQRYV
jgi:hypothetical protein